MSDDGLLLDAVHMQRALERIAHEIIERHHEIAAVVLVGIRSRGVHLARRIASKVTELTSSELQVGSIDITAYRDDVEQPRERIEVTATEIPLPIDERVVVLVDDVISTGRTVRVALDVLGGLGRPRAVQVAALVDRGDREVPIKADFVGYNVARGEQRRVHVHVRELDGADEVRLQ
ncbi:MAG: bifunctional pyr operon transcriptional regulator/uracil phosphoribosyltransferase PyrR [Deltaproteobacteria bacterium]|nr:bifunctional pyr operon transcriptional regulator/uracil phosphoribosyltransferase PyrR [Deltaproteobacteria bacterium]